MKKIVSYLALFGILFGIFGNNAYAVVGKYTNTSGVVKYKNVSVNKLTNTQLVSKYMQINHGNFLEKFQGKTGVYKVNFKNITPQNAAQVQAVFTSKKNFPKKFVLPEGFTYEVKTNDLNKEFVKTNTLLSKVNTLKNHNIKIGNLKIKEPVLQVLPDRIQYIKRAEISFNTATELKNIKKYLGKDFKLSDGSLNKLGLKLNQDADKKFGDKNFKINPLNKKVVTSDDVEKAFDRLKRFGRYKKNSKLNKNYDIFTAIDDNKIYADLIKECKANGGNDNKCNINELKNNSTKTLTLEDKVEYSLIPTTLEDIKNNRILIKYNPINNKNVFNLSKNEIYSRFVDLRSIQLSGISINKNFIPSGPAAKHDIEAEDYCEILHKKEGSDVINECKKKQEEMKKITKAEYENVLLNGFTLGESKNYSWGTSLSVGVPFVGSVKVFSVDFGLYYSYGFGIRIPIKVKGTISDNIVNDFKAENALFTGSINVDTFDGSGSFYRSVGLPESKVFRGKEFVFELSAGANIEVWVKYLGSKKIEIPFISMLATIFGNDILDSLGLETDADVAALNIPGINSRAKMLGYIIEHNGLDQSKDFVPPFAGSNKIRLFKFLTPEIPFYNNGVIKFVGKAGVKSDLDGRVTMKCESINANGGCPAGDPANSVTETESNINIGADSSRIHINTKNTYVGHGKAVFDGDKGAEDELGFYSKFGLNFYDFRYHPVLLFTVFIRAGIGAHIPLGVGWKTYWTPDIDIYTFKFSSDALYLGTHDGINEKNTHFEMLENNRIYSTVSTLTDIDSINISKIGGKYLPRSILTILPENNYAGANNTYYRIDGKVPYSQFGTCSTFNEDGTIEYNKPTVIWPNAKDELVNSKIFKISAKSCDRLILGKPKSEKQKSLNKSIVIDNYYHKVFPSGGDDISLGQDGNSVTSPLRLEEMDEIKATANIKCTPSFQLHGHPENKDYYIMYNIVPKDTGSNSSVGSKGNISGNLGVNVNSYGPSNAYLNQALVTEFRDYPRCDGSVGKLYKGENIVLVPKGAYNNDPVNRIFVDTPSIIYAIKCIGKSNPNVRGNVFSSIITKIDFEFANGGLCEDQKDDLQHGDLGGIKDKIDKVLGTDDVQFGGYGNDMYGGVVKSVGNLKTKGGFKGNINGSYFGTKQTFGVNSQNQNPWKNQKGINLGKSNPGLQQQNSGLAGKTKKTYEPFDDGIQRKYAKTRFPRCGEKDIIIGNQVWAACNETKKVSQAYGPYGKATDKDEHGWTYGLLYNKEARSKLCGDGYRLPTPNELKKLGKIKNIFNILKLTNKYFDHKFYSGYHYYYYYSNDSSSDGLAIDLESGRPIHIYFYKRGYPVRCIRNTPATAEELGQGSNSNEQNGNNNQANNSQGDLTSNDEYVNEKLDEINECFLNTYNSHLKNIDDTIKKFRDTMNKSNDENTKKKYEKAIKKLEEIKRLFIKKYKFILDYKK